MCTLAFADHRSRPFYDLVSRVGCRAGHARWAEPRAAGLATWTAVPVKRWPGAVIEAMDSSPENGGRPARERGIDASTGDLRTWQPSLTQTVVVSNAAMHWVPEHADLMVRWTQELAPDRGSPFRYRGTSTRRHIPRRGPWPAANNTQSPAQQYRFESGAVVHRRRITPVC